MIVLRNCLKLSKSHAGSLHSRGNEFQTTLQLAMHFWITITPRALHWLTSQWGRPKQIVEVTVISSAGLIRFKTRQILRANPSQMRVIGKGKSNVSAGDEITRFHLWSNSTLDSVAEWLACRKVEFRCQGALFRIPFGGITPAPIKISSQNLVCAWKMGSRNVRVWWSMYARLEYPRWRTAVRSN